MSNHLERAGMPDSFIEITPLKTGGRVDWRVLECKQSVGLPAPFAETDITTQLRLFFDKLDQEIEKHRDDPIALVNALARMEAVLADVRTVTQNVRTAAAEALNERGIRRMTVEGLTTVEGTSQATRTDWDNQRLLRDMLTAELDTMVNTRTGEVVDNDELAQRILSWFRVEWRLTQIREAGLDVDDYSTQPTDEDGKAIRTPAIRIHENVLRKQAVV